MQSLRLMELTTQLYPYPVVIVDIDQARMRFHDLWASSLRADILWPVSGSLLYLSVIREGDRQEAALAGGGPGR
jgi:hypothetical protein